ncbi:C80 family cysteine peptidase [Roseateles chitinivorans]|uniref:C80 family cysteine peptidase n=1 Tax=Roseateles chitinivorans TaxID=2917965 RepID=UPI003D674622
MNDAFAGPPSQKRTRPDTLQLVLQMNDSPAALEAALRHAVKRKDSTVWVQLDRHGSHKIVTGEALLAEPDKYRAIKLMVVGDASTSPHHDRLLSGYDADLLARRLADFLRSCLGSARIHSATLLSCALDSPLARSSFPRNFLERFSDTHLTAAGFVVTAFSRDVLFPDDSPASTRRASPDVEGKWRHRALNSTFTTDRRNQRPRRLDKYGKGRPGAIDPTRDLTGDITPAIAATALGRLDGAKAAASAGDLLATVGRRTRFDDPLQLDGLAGLTPQSALDTLRGVGDSPSARTATCGWTFRVCPPRCRARRPMPPVSPARCAWPDHCSRWRRVTSNAWPARRRTIRSSGPSWAAPARSGRRVARSRRPPSRIRCEAPDGRKSPPRSTRSNCPTTGGRWTPPPRDWPSPARPTSWRLPCPKRSGRG